MVIEPGIQPMSDDSMGFFIEVQDGVPVGHPISGWNFQLFFQDFDPNNPPAPFHKFVRKMQPRTKAFEKFLGVTYELVDGVYTDVFHFEPMSAEEKDKKYKDWLKTHPKPFVSWILNEDELFWQAPIPYPNDGEKYVWNEKLGNWQPELEWLKFLETDSTLLKKPPIKGHLESPNDLPENYNGAEGDFYTVGSNTIYTWIDNQWQESTVGGIPTPNLANATVIDATINNTQVRILGVKLSLDLLDPNFTGLVADGYIIEDINKVYAWTGTEWAEATVLDFR